jgi:hypothetical protein
MKVYFCTALRKNSPLRGASEKYCTLQLLVRSLFVAFASIVLSLEKQCGGIYLETNGRAKMVEPKQDREMTLLNFCSLSDDLRIRYTVKKG